MICKNCKHEIMTCYFSIQDNMTSPPAVFKEFEQYYHIGYGNSCSKRLRPITSMKDWGDPTGWCQCNNPEPMGIDELKNEVWDI
jgi:hypothetical protein